MRDNKIIKIGFDLDGVIIDKPQFVPKFVMEWLVRSHKNKNLEYRYPELKIERWIRWLSHNPILRHPINKNLILIKNLYKTNKYKLYIVSSRYSFLEGRTKEWFTFYKLDNLFKGIHINQDNLQPHIFKKEMIRKLKLDVFIDDDLPLLNYLGKHLKNIQLVSVENQEKHLKGLSK